MSERTYLVGLPVAVAIHDGRVHLAVDAAELTSALSDYDGVGLDDEPSDAEREDDVRTVAHAFTALVEERQGWRITAATMQHEQLATRRIRGRWLRGRART